MRTLTSTVDVGRPAGEVHDAWARYDEFPDFMPSVASVQRLDDSVSRWVVTVGRERRAFDATITSESHGEHLAWASAGSPAHEGVVLFRSLSDDRTRVTVVVSWEPGGLFDKIGARFGLVGRDLDSSLEAFRAHVDPVAARSPATPRPATKERDRGRTADSPTEIPLPGWRDILKRTLGQLKSDNVPIIAAGVAYYLFLALLPALAAVISVYGLVADPNDVSRQLDSLLGALPADAASFLQEQIETIVGTSSGGLGLSVVVSVLLALWSASKGMQALVIALNVAYDEEETRKFVKLRGLALGLTVGLVVASAVLVGGMALIGALADRLGTAAAWAVTILRWPVLALLLLGLLAVLYRHAPDRDPPKWRWVSPGALIAVVLWVLGSVAFNVYVTNFGSYNETYGTLAAAVLLLLWLYLSAYIIILGAEFDAETERQTVKDSTVGPHEPLGARRAYAADTVAPSP